MKINYHYLRKYSNFIMSFDDQNQQQIEKHHILPKSLFPEYKDDRNNICSLSPRAHYIAHVILTKAFPESKEMQTALWFMMNTRDVKYSSKQYEKSKIYHSKYSSKIMSKAMKGKTTYVDDQGNRYHLDTNDEKIEELGLVHRSKGMCTFTDGCNNYYLNTSDPIINELNLKSVNEGKTNISSHIRMKDMVYVKDNNGEVHHVSITDPRYTNGDLFHINKGTVNVVADGINKKVSIEDFYSQNHDHINKGKVDVIDNNGNVFKVAKSDERLVTGELKLNITDNRRNAGKKSITNYNKSCIGKTWMTSPEGKEKFVEESDIEILLNENWVIGRKSTKFKGTATNKGKTWINDSIKELAVLKNEVDEYLDNGWIKGRLKRAWINKDSNAIQVLITELDSYLDKGWERGRK